MTVTIVFINEIEVSFSIIFQKYHLPSFDADIDQRCFPMAYAFGKNQPDPLVCCDISNCQVTSDDGVEDITRMNCGHTIHNCCLQTLTLKSSHCPICVPLFDARVKELSEAFNNYLLGQDDEDLSNEDQNDETVDTGLEDDNVNDEVELGQKEDSAKAQVKYCQRVAGLREQVEMTLGKLETKTILPRCQNKQTIAITSSEHQHEHDNPIIGSPLATASSNDSHLQTSGTFRCTHPGCERICRSKGGLKNHERTHKK